MEAISALIRSYGYANAAKKVMQMLAKHKEKVSAFISIRFEKVVELLPFECVWTFCGVGA